VAKVNTSSIFVPLVGGPVGPVRLRWSCNFGGVTDHDPLSKGVSCSSFKLSLVFFKNAEAVATS
jgi:hypothetical protein